MWGSSSHSAVGRPPLVALCPPSSVLSLTKALGAPATTNPTEAVYLDATHPWPGFYRRPPTVKGSAKPPHRHVRHATCALRSLSPCAPGALRYAQHDHRSYSRKQKTISCEPLTELTVAKQRPFSASLASRTRIYLPSRQYTMYVLNACNRVSASPWAC